MTRNESANSQQLLHYNTGELYSAGLPFSAAGYGVSGAPINPALSVGLIPWRNQFTVGGCYTYRTCAVIKLLLRADRTPIDMGGHRTPTLGPPRRIYGPFIPERVLY